MKKYMCIPQVQLFNQWFYYDSREFLKKLRFFKEKLYEHNLRGKQDCFQSLPVSKSHLSLWMYSLIIIIIIIMIIIIITPTSYKEF